MFTRWVPDTAAKEVPRELTIEVRGPAASLDTAIDEFGALVRPLVMVVAFLANVRVGALEVYIGFEDSPGKSSRPFVEVFTPDEVGGVPDGRYLRVSDVRAAVDALLRSTEQKRLVQTLHHYELALRDWYIGGESVSIGQLYMAVESLTPAIVRLEASERGLTIEQLADSLQIDASDPSRPRWKEALHTWCRSEVIFRGDNEIYRLAKLASDGFEHGFLELDKVAESALAAGDKTFEYVRASILRLLAIDPVIQAKILNDAVLDVQSKRQIVRGTLVGDGPDLSAPDEQYPIVRWERSLSTIELDAGVVGSESTNKFIATLADGIELELNTLDDVQRVSAGAIQVKRSPLALTVPHGFRSESNDLLAQVLPLVNSATKPAEEIPMDFPLPLVFALFSQCVALYEAAYTLVLADLAIEGLPQLLSMAAIAARLEQVSKIGIGAIVRLKVDSDLLIVAEDSPVSLSAEDADVGHQAAEDLLERAHVAGCVVPETLPPVSSTDIWHKLSVEIWLAESLQRGEFSTVNFHASANGDAEHVRFDTRKSPSRTSDGVASACVIAQLSALQYASALLDWPVNRSQLDSILAKATSINDTAFE
jgi:hypothetical protein